MIKRRAAGFAAAVTLVAGPAIALVAAAPASAAVTCVHGIQDQGGIWGDRAYASCVGWERRAQQARVTADCIAGPDRNSSWFHDYATHYTGSCGTFGITNQARAAIMSFRY